MKGSLRPAVYIDRMARLSALAVLLNDEPLIAIDTESNSMHAYRERICLVQISTREHDYIIDPLMLDNLDPLGSVLANPAIEKVFHAAEYDLLCLRRDYGFEINTVFDTMIAARICGYKNVGLNHLLKQHLDIQLDKSHQRDNWGERPLPEDSLHYAQMDTHYLPTLRDILSDELRASGHADEALEIFEEIATDTRAHEGRNFDPEGYWNIALPNQVFGAPAAVLREVYLLREQIAEAMDRPPFRAISNAGLLALAQQMPASMRKLSEIPDLPYSIVRRYGDDILQAVQRGRAAEAPSPPQHRPPPAEISDLYIALHTWRKERAAARGVESDVIIPKHTLWSLAYKLPDSHDELDNIRGLGPWRLRQYGDEILGVVKQFKAEHNGYSVNNGEPDMQRLNGYRPRPSTNGNRSST
ncbi:MAG TPA: HRDC domain-containing protein [Aggregatilineales bacterium]|jgi:ribonuclease D|nr:HRDC domain-containing protein [Aggregatilineales bacterium]